MKIERRELKGKVQEFDDFCTFYLYIPNKSSTFAG